MGKRNAEHSLDQSHLEATPLKQKKLDFDSPVCNQEFALTRELVDGTILTDLTKKRWRVGRPIGKSPSSALSLRKENVFHENCNYQRSRISIRLCAISSSADNLVTSTPYWQNSPLSLYTSGPTYTSIVKIVISKLFIFPKTIWVISLNHLLKIYIWWLIEREKCYAFLECKNVHINMYMFWNRSSRTNILVFDVYAIAHTHAQHVRLCAWCNVFAFKQVENREKPVWCCCMALLWVLCGKMRYVQIAELIPWR